MDTHAGKATAVAAFFVFNLFLYSSRASFSLRPGTEERLFPLMSAAFLAMTLGGWIMPALYRFAAARAADVPAVRALRKIPLLLVLAAPLLASAFGYRVWLTYEPFRYFLAVAIGPLMAAVHFALFRHGEARRRGLWLGVAAGGGMLAWRGIVWFAAAWRGEPLPGFHPGLYPIFVICTVAAAAFLLLMLRAPFAEYGADAPFPPGRYFSPLPEGERRRRVRLLLAASFSLCLLNGILEARLFPVLVLIPSRLGVALPVLLALVVPLSGRLLDRDPDRNLPRFLRGWAYFFILAPSLAAMGEDTPLYRCIHSVCSVGQVALLVIITAAAAGYARNATQAAAYAGVLFGMRITAIYWEELLDLLPDPGAGVSVLLATVAAFVYHQIAVRIESPPADAERAEAPPEDGAGREKGSTAVRERFLHSAGLTPRELDIAARVLEGASSREIAAVLGISDNTVNFHIKKILDKYGINSRKALMALYAEALQNHPNI